MKYKNLPQTGVKALGAVWDLGRGLHPALVGSAAYFQMDPFACDTETTTLFEKYGVPLSFDTAGHNVVRDEGYAELVEAQPYVPISPLFVRDLAGRVVYTGYGPQRRTAAAWQERPAATFPLGCREVPATMEGADKLEKVFMTFFRPLEMTLTPNVRGADEKSSLAAGSYPNANLYPYKLRVDTFYQDGWRLPQTEMLFVKVRRTDLANAQALARDFIKKWDTRPEGQSYAEFHKEVGGAEFFRNLYLNGCTVIPALGARNGFWKVGEDFSIQGRWPGRAVEGLHEIAEERRSDAPKGTIVELLRPGFMTGDALEPAVVAVSDGSGYQSPNAGDAPPLMPDLFLPHPRLSANWGSTWLPTAPAHFEAPALWGWDTVTGHFVQKSGPVWDPLHYYYSSVDTILEAFQRAGENNPVPVSEETRERFHPIVEMEGFDTFNGEQRHRARREKLFPVTIITRVGKEASAPVGYHPMPAQFEYELDNWWFPEHSPRNRVTNDAKTGVGERISPVISVQVGVEDYLKTLNVPAEALWITDGTRLRATSQSELGDYPELSRFLSWVEDKDIPLIAQPFLAYLPREDLNMPVQELLGDPEASEKLESLATDFYDALYRFYEKGFAWRRRRYATYKGNLKQYTIDWWRGQLSQEIPAPPSETTPPEREGREKGVPLASVIEPPTI